VSTTEDEVTTGAWPLLRGWWEDKPKPHQNLVIVGAIATVVFLGAGVLLETWLEGWAKNIPSLAGFVWDVAKALLIGTVLFSVIDVLRSWGMSWRVLKVSEDALYQEVGAFLNTVNNYLGLNLVIGVFGPRTTTSSVRRVEEALQAVFYERSKINDYALALHRRARDPSEKVPDATPTY